MAWPGDPSRGGGRARAAAGLPHRDSQRTRTETGGCAQRQACCQTLRDKQGWCLPTERVSNLMCGRKGGSGAVAPGWAARSSLTGVMLRLLPSCSPRSVFAACSFSTSPSTPFIPGLGKGVFIKSEKYFCRRSAKLVPCSAVCRPAAASATFLYR